MLARLSDHIRACYQRSAQAQELAAKADVALKSRHLDMAKWWAYLAHSYEFIEGLERFLLEIDAAATSRREQASKQPTWRLASTAPYDRDLRLAVLDEEGTAHALVFPCRRVLGGWIQSETKARIPLDPTHWQEWLATP